MRKEHAKHGRDHGPNGMDPIPGVGGAVWAWCQTSEVTIPTATWTSISWDSFRTNKHISGTAPVSTVGVDGFYTYQIGGGDANTTGNDGLWMEGFYAWHAAVTVEWGIGSLPTVPTNAKARLAYFTQNVAATWEGSTVDDTSTSSSITIVKDFHAGVNPSWSGGDYGLNAGEYTDNGVRSFEISAYQDDGSDRTCGASLIVTAWPLETNFYERVYGTVLS